MKKIFITLFSVLFATLSLVSCEMMKESLDAEDVKAISTTFRINPVTGWVGYDGSNTPDPNFNVSGIDVIFTNPSEDSRIVATSDNDGYVTVDLVQGLYNVTVAAAAENQDKTYYLNGVLSGISIVTSNDKQNPVTLNIRPALVGPLVFKEIFYCGSIGNYFRNQFYEIYNNGDEVYFLDYLVFGKLYPEYATEIKPAWPESDGRENFIYGQTLWQFPLNAGDQSKPEGQRLPLAPGESIVIAQEAADHSKVQTWSGDYGMLDTSSAEFEAWAGNPDRVNLSVPDLVRVYHAESFWVQMQWLTGVGGSAFFLYDAGRRLNLNDPEYWTVENGTIQNETGKTTYYAKIPVEKVIDGIECIPNISQLNSKRMVGFIDAGAISTNETYVGISNARKVIGTRADGTPILSDTNNSLEDFENLDSPVLRRHNPKAPSWSASNN